jgi:glucose-1-phosphatase
MKVDALLFDLGGVVIDIDLGRAFTRWAATAGTTVETIRSRFAFDAAYERHERGEIQADEYFASLRSSLQVELSNAELSEGWTAIYLGEVPGIRTLLSTLEGRLPLYAFTNSNPTHQAFWASRYAEVLTSFRRVFVSSEIGVRKPEPAAFAAISAAIDVPLERILFFDDTLANVEGARAVGMPAVHVRSLADIARAIDRL